MGTQPKFGFSRVGEASPTPRRAKRFGKKERCRSGKVRYPSESLALESLRRVRRERYLAGEGGLHENHVYPCRDCKGYHLASSSHDQTVTEPAEQHTNEPTDAYIMRLERRIAEQRSQIFSLQVIGNGSSNRESRKRIASLIISLGKMTERWEDEHKARVALSKKVKELESRPPRGKRGWFGKT